MPFPFSCPQCAKKFLFPDTKQGKEHTCSKCGAKFVAGGAASVLPADDVMEVMPVDMPGGPQPPAITTQPGGPRPPALQTQPSAGVRPPAPPPTPRRSPQNLQPQGGRSGFLLIPLLVGGTSLFLMVGVGVAAYVVLNSHSDDAQVAAPMGPQPVGPGPVKPWQPIPQVKDGIAPRADGGPAQPVVPPVENFFRQPKDLDEAIAFLKDNNQDRVQTGLSSLSRMAVVEDKKAEVCKALEPLVNDLRTRNAAARQLGRWAVPESAQALIKVLEIPKDDLTSKDAKKEAMRALAKFKTPAALPLIVDCLHDFFVQREAQEALQTWGPSAESEVAKLVFDPDFGVRGIAGRLLTGFGTKNNTVIKPAVAALESPNLESKKVAAEWLAKLKVVPEEQAAVAKALDATVQDKDFFLRDNSVKALAVWANADNLPTIQRLLADPMSPDKGKLVEALGNIKDQKAVELAFAALIDTKINVQNQAITALQKQGPIAEKTVVSGLESPNQNVRVLIIGVLRQIGTKEISVPALAKQSLREKSNAVKGQINQAIMAINARAAAPK
jgi:HEAT repeat protein